MKKNTKYILLITLIIITSLVAYEIISIQSRPCLLGNHLHGFRYVSQKIGSNCGGACLEMVIRFIKGDYSNPNYNQCSIDGNFRILSGFSRSRPCISPCTECNNPNNCVFAHDKISIKNTLYSYTISSNIKSLPIIEADIINQIQTKKKPIIAYGDLNVRGTRTDHFIVIVGYDYIKSDSKCKLLIEIYDPYGCNTCTYKVPLSGGLFTFESLIYIN